MTVLLGVLYPILVLGYLAAGVWVVRARAEQIAAFEPGRTGQFGLAVVGVLLWPVWLGYELIERVLFSVMRQRQADATRRAAEWRASAASYATSADPVERRLPAYERDRLLREAAAIEQTIERGTG